MMPRLNTKPLPLDTICHSPQGGRTGTRLPIIIQGGMGAAVSSWKLARTVALAGQMGVVSGTALDVVFARRLQNGDPGGEIRSACAEFPVPGVAERVLARHYFTGGRAVHQPYRPVA